MAFLDAAARRLGACEFADDEHFCSLEAVLLQLGAKEIVLPKVTLCTSSGGSHHALLMPLQDTVHVIRFTHSSSGELPAVDVAASMPRALQCVGAR